MFTSSTAGKMMSVGVNWPGRVLLLGQEVAVVVEPDAGVHRQPVAQPPRVLRVEADRVEAVFRLRRLEEHHFGRRAAAKDVQHVVVRARHDAAACSFRGTIRHPA